MSRDSHNDHNALGDSGVVARKRPPLLDWQEANPELADAARHRGGQAQKKRFDLTAVARDYAPEAIATLVGAMRGRDMRVKVEAAIHLLDRGFGKAAQLVEYQGEVEFRLGSLDDATLEALIRERLKGLGLTGKVKPPPALESSTLSAHEGESPTSDSHQNGEFAPLSPICVRRIANGSKPEG